VPDELPTIWRAEPHTLAKHAILKKYLEAWMPILSHQTAKHPARLSRIWYVDGFAGPGEYVNGEPGSPVIALQTALDHSHIFPTPVRFLFVEARKDRLDHLRAILARYDEAIRSSKRVEDYETKLGDCADTLNRYLDQRDEAGKAFGPALVFLDQSGYSAVPIDLIGRVMRYPVCEVFSYLDWKDLNRFITDESKWAGLTRTFGGDEWRDAIGMGAADRRAFLLKAYRSSLQQRAGVEFFCYFSMHDENGQLLYWLFFCTGHLAGLEQMKKAMWSVDETGSFRFSDSEAPGQLLLLDGFDQSWLANTLSDRHRGKALTIQDVERFVLVHTPCYKYIDALRILEKEARADLLGAPPDRRKGAFKKYKGNTRVKVLFK